MKEKLELRVNQSCSSDGWPVTGIGNFKFDHLEFTVVLSKDTMLPDYFFLCLELLSTDPQPQ